MYSLIFWGAENLLFHSQKDMEMKLKHKSGTSYIRAASEIQVCFWKHEKMYRKAHKKF